MFSVTDTVGSNPLGIWEVAVAMAGIKAKHAFPQGNGRIEKGMALVLAGAVELLGGSKARVTSQHDPLVSYLVEGRACPCPDATRTGELCKHSYAAYLMRKAIQIAKELPAVEQEETTDTQKIPAEYWVNIRGKRFPRYAGLLAMAHDNILSMEVEVITVTTDLAVMKAIVKMKDGSTWSDVGDATPTNVSDTVRPHFVRMAATRATARALRKALGIGTACSVELCTDDN